MATEATVLVASVEKNDKGWYELVDGNGTKYSTKKQSIAEPAYGLVDKQAKLTFTVSQNGDFTNRYLDAVEAVEAAAAQQTNGDHPVETGEKAESIRRAVALKAAVDTMSHTVATSATPKAAYMKVVLLADAYLKWLEGTPAVAVGTLPAGDEDIPF